MQLDPSALLEIVLRIAAAMIVFLIGRWLARRARKALRVALGKTTVGPSMVRLLLLTVYYGILVTTVIVALALLGFSLTLSLGALFIILILLGIALQQSISNLAATVIFLIFQPFRSGELIDANGVQGTVSEIQLFSTVLVAGDNKVITIPNSKIQNDTLINLTRAGRLRVDFVFSVSYTDDLRKVKAVLHEILATDERVLAEPAPLIFVQTLAENSVNIAVQPWVKSEDYTPIQRDIPEQVKLRFDAEGITIPFPQRDIHLHGRDAAE